MRWIDGTTLHSISVQAFKSFSVYEDVCGAMFTNSYQRVIRVQSCYSTCNSFLCERQVKTTRPASGPVEFTKLETHVNASQKYHLLVKCSENHLVRDFLRCDFQSNCGGNQFADHCVVVSTKTVRTSNTVTQSKTNDEKHPRQAEQSEAAYSGYKAVISVGMFHCHQYGGTIPYTLVCDFRNDCADNSDEESCKHKQDKSSFR